MYIFVTLYWCISHSYRLRIYQRRKQLNNIFRSQVIMYSTHIPMNEWSYHWIRSHTMLVMSALSQNLVILYSASTVCVCVCECLYKTVDDIRYFTHILLSFPFFFFVRCPTYSPIIIIIIKKRFTTHRVRCTLKNIIWKWWCGVGGTHHKLSIHCATSYCTFYIYHGMDGIRIRYRKIINQFSYIGKVYGGCFVTNIAS